MSALPVVEAILNAAPGVTGVVQDRIYYVTAPQGAARPYLVLVQTDETDETLLGGQSQYPESLISVISYADDYPTVETLGNEVVAALQDASGTWRGIDAVLSRDPGDSFDFLPTDRVHRRISNFKIRYR